MVLGHEGVGIVETVGPACHSLKRGDHVGWSYEVDCCGHCIQCLQGTENFCPDRAMYGVSNADQGSFAPHAIWRESFLYPIPQGLSDIEAAPLQYGATTFNALQGIKPGDTVGVKGVGRLGHLAIQLAAKIGCHVVVLSSSERKKADTLQLGAHEFIATKDAKKLEVSSPISLLLVTAAVPPNWELILPIMASKSAIYPLSVSDGNLQISYMGLILQGISVHGSLVAPRHLHRKMLEFAAQHQIKPVVETFPMTEQDIKQAMDKLERGEVTYRAVLIPK